MKKELIAKLIEIIGANLLKVLISAGLTVAAIYAISKTILGMLILCAISGNKKAPKEIITRDKASKFSIN